MYEQGNSEEVIFLGVGFFLFVFALICGPRKTGPKMQDAEILEVADKSQK